MSRKTRHSAPDLFDEVLALVGERMPSGQVAQVKTYVREFYRHVDPADLRDRPALDLYGAAVSHWLLARQRSGGESKLRILNPRVDEHGWECPHTVIELVNRDVPFLVDSVRMEVNAHGFATHLIIHPVISLRRDEQGNLVEIHQAVGTRSDSIESCMYLEISRETDAAALESLERGLRRVLADVHASVEDWVPMRQRMSGVVAAIKANPPQLPKDEVAEAGEFLEWLTSNHFTFLGVRDYDLMREGGDDVLRIVPGSGLGILREKPGIEMSASFATLPAQMRECARKPELLIITKSNSRSSVHRPGYMDYVGIKRFDDAGNVIGEHRFLGLYTSVAYSRSVNAIPLLRRKVSAVIEAAGVMPNSHRLKALQAILESYPRDELFQIEVNDLLRVAMGIMHLEERQRTRLFVRRDPFGRFFSCLIFAPRDSYSTDVRQRMQALLMEAFEGASSTFTVNVSDSVLARLLIVVHAKPGARQDYDERALEGAIAAIARRWEDELADALTARHGEETGRDLYRAYCEAFPAGYRENYAPRDAVYDVELMESVTTRDGISLNLYKPIEAGPGELRFKLVKRGGIVPLSQSLPMLEHMGVRVIDERRYQIDPAGGAPIWVHDMGLRADVGIDIEIDAVRNIFHDAFQRVWRGAAESDDFNRLVLRGKLNWREVALLRGYAKYARQAGFTFSQAYMEAALGANPDIARQLVALFVERFDPDRTEPVSSRGKDCEKSIEAALDAVASLDEDRIIRRMLALIVATTRTNYFQLSADGAAKPYLSLKFDSALVPALPEPRPMFEIFVYSPRIEGVHLRGGLAARGGLRWSDRMEDYRTEVLGLMKAQMVKNAVIVPVGAKGGFVVKKPPADADRATRMEEVVYCYKTFLRGLLDLTGNRLAGQVVPPSRLVRHDDDDTYLVVAADKGTATFSDIANDVAAEYGFWMGDAFASGGSSGYDHKKMGITARGAWESVKTHARTLGIDIETTGLSVVGIGDMSGDVFGNGMLLSKRIRLLAAFDHRHIFIDPEPDPEQSFVERGRLFALPRSSWVDYNSTLISEGGGVYPRSAKSIVLSQRARRALGIEATVMTPNELIHALLCAPVDLLFNGGIGTYVKSSAESHADAGDRANDAVRVNGDELRCRLVGEGGNLGLTQRGRVEYALNGGRIFSDAIDNSAGVSCSDHEVNIKILLNGVMAEGELTEKQRNQLLGEMTDEVAALVLRDNTYQAQSLAVTEAQGVALLGEQASFMRYLERQELLRRDIEFLPSDEEIGVRKAARAGLAAPENAVLLAYGKIWLYRELLSSTVPDDPFVATAIARYFPSALRDRFRDAMHQHPLRSEIVATHLCNSMVNRVGSTFVHRLMVETGARPSDVVRAYLMARESFGLVQLWSEIESLQNPVDEQVRISMLVHIGRLTIRATRWFLRRRKFSEDLNGVIRRFAGPIRIVIESLEPTVDANGYESIGKRAEELVLAGVPRPLAQRAAVADLVQAAPDIIELAQDGERTVQCVTRVFFMVSARFDLSWFRERIATLAADTHWQTLAQTALQDELDDLLRTLTANVLGQSPGITRPQELIAGWEENNRSPFERVQQVLADVRTADNPDLAMLSVSLRELRNLV
jgi:glutamate dehydrogenase